MASDRREEIYRVQANRLRAAHAQAGLETDDLVAILRACSIRVVAKGEGVCAEGDPGLELFFLLRGTIVVHKLGVDGVERPVGELTAPTLLGQMGVVDRARRTATCVASSEVILAVMGQDTFQRVVRDTGAHGRALRRLLLSSLTLQLIGGNSRLRGLLAARNDPRGVGGAGWADALQHARDVLEGWTGDATLPQQAEATSRSEAAPGGVLDPKEGPA